MHAEVELPNFLYSVGTAELQLLSPQGELISRLEGHILDAEEQFRMLGDPYLITHVVKFPDAIDFLTQAKGTPAQARVALNLVDPLGNDVPGDIVHSGDKLGRRTVAAIDILRANEFAFSAQGADLMYQGLVIDAVKAAGFGDQLWIGGSQ